MLARNRADAIVTAQELQRVIAARRALRREDRRGSPRHTTSAPLVAPVVTTAGRVAPVLREHDARNAPRH